MLARALRAGRGLGAGRGWAAGKTGARRCAVAGGRRWFAGEPQRPADDRDRSRGRALPYGAAARVQVTRTEISQEVFDVSGALREFVPARPAGEQDPWAPADAPGEDVSRGHRVARNRHTAGMESLPSMRPSTPAARCVAYCTAETYGQKPLPLASWGGSPGLEGARQAERGARRVAAFGARLLALSDARGLVRVADWDALLKALQKDMVPSIYFSEVIHVSVTNENSFREEGGELRVRRVPCCQTARPSSRAHLLHTQPHVLARETLGDNMRSGRGVADVFFFRDGCMVLWDVTPARTRQLLETIQPFQVSASVTHAECEAERRRVQPIPQAPMVSRRAFLAC